MRIKNDILRHATSRNDPWVVGNGVLYDLCWRFPQHRRTPEIVAKVWLIGRAYSAAVERGRGNGPDVELSNDRFYAEAVPKALQRSRLDQMLSGLKGFSTIDRSNADQILIVHGHLVEVFESLTGKEERSLASKYLHFHRPDLFFIYDSRAVRGIRLLRLPRPPAIQARGVDPTYARFVSAAIALRDEIASRFGRSLSPRELDPLLLKAIEVR
jgi:hypothetical protein